MTDKALTLDGLETVYDTLATALDHAGPDKAELFLVKLALLHAQAWPMKRCFGSRFKRHCSTSDQGTHHEL